MADAAEEIKEAVVDAANAQEVSADAVKDAAVADAQKTIAETTATTVAAAEAAAALANTEAAKSTQAAAETIKEGKEDLSWLKLSHESMAASLQNLQTQIQETNSRIQPLAEIAPQLQAALSTLSKTPETLEAEKVKLEEAEGGQKAAPKKEKRKRDWV